ncbi:MAG: hypothetical protein D6E12_03190 [Desulfovibrio sp.]|nr:MAG: hypothetical protein D6E12_03190 [Desulfovibrio sp.]
MSHYLARPSRSPQLDRLAVGGMVAMAAMTVLGVLLSLSEQPQFIKLALHRASMLLVIIGLVYVVDGLWRDIRTGPWWLAAVAGTVLISNFLSGSSAGFPVALCLLLAWPSIKTFFRGKERPTGAILAVFLAAVLCLLMALYYSKGWLSSWQTPAYFGGKQNIVALFMLSMLMIVINFCKEKRESWKIVPGLAVLIIFFFTAVAWVQDSVPGAYSRTRKVEYMEAQLWAKDNTETDALFMVDPTISYGWRDFSSRSSFGVLREWLYTCYGYTNDYDAWVLGRERFGEYGIDLDQSVPEPSIIWGDIITEAVLKQFYTWDKERFAQLADKYGITHIVMQKMFVQADLGMDMVFENNFFIILAAP